MKNKCSIIIAFICFIPFIKTYSQCAIPAGAAAKVGGSVGCASCTEATDADGPLTSGTVCITGARGTFTDYAFQTGTFRVCSGGSVTLTNTSWGGAGGCKIVIESGGTLTISDAIAHTGFSGYAGNSIENYGTLNFSSSYASGSGAISTPYLFTGSTGTTNFNSTAIFYLGGQLISAGTMNFTGQIQTWSGTAPQICLDRSYTTVGDVTTWVANSFGWGGLSATLDTAAIKYTGTQDYRTLSFTNSARVKLCRASGTAIASLSSKGSATVLDATCSSPPLPVLLSKFFAQANSNAVELFWVTAQEFNNDHFEILRSYDGESWEQIGTVKGNGTKSNATFYAFNDNDVDLNQNVYYKLKQVDVDGVFETSPVISIHANLVGYHVSIFPNPLEKGTKLYANFSGNDKGAATVFLSDMAGKLISTYLFDDIEPGGIYLIKDESLLLPKGNYFVEIKTQQSVRTEKLVVK